nr:hypothetical protein MFLOJ_12020 [Mycobacterium florentinum]
MRTWRGHQNQRLFRRSSTVITARRSGPGASAIVARAAKCYAARQSTSFNDPSGEAEKEVKVSHECRG